MRSKKLTLCVMSVVLGIAPLWAAENDLANNKYLVENKRLVALAEKSLTDGKYDDAVKNAADAEKFADQSDKYVDAYKAFDAAQARMAWAEKTGIRKRYAEIYAEAETAFAEATGFRSAEKWDETKAAAERVITIMAQLPEEVPLPAQYMVKAWSQVKDCLWNIAARPEVYNDPAQWRRLYTANRSKFPQPDNPNLIEPGMVLDIPSINDEYRFGVLEGE
jgi:nucleoid-associated protein YgaU